MNTKLLWIAGLFLMCLAAGCGGGGKLPKTVTAQGIVLLDGLPVQDATVSFISETNSYHATGITNSEGKFTLSAFTQKSGAVPGDYKVEVNKTVVSGNNLPTESESGAAASEGENQALNISFGLPPHYASFTTSQLVATIPETGTSDLKLELKNTSPSP